MNEVIDAYFAGYQAGYENGKRDTVKHGEWLENGANYKCSECGNTESYYSDSYCRVCGAKMDGGTGA